MLDGCPKSDCVRRSVKAGWRLTSEGCSYSLPLVSMLLCIVDAKRDVNVNVIGNKPEVT